MSNLAWLPDALRRHSKLRILAPGDTLFRQGDRATAIFEVEQGRMRLIRHSIDNRPVTLHTARAGELFAEAALFADRYHCDPWLRPSPACFLFLNANSLLRSEAIQLLASASWRP